MDGDQRAYLLSLLRDDRPLFWGITVEDLPSNDSFRRLYDAGWITRHKERGYMLTESGTELALRLQSAR